LSRHLLGIAVPPEDAFQRSQECASTSKDPSRRDCKWVSRSTMVEHSYSWCCLGRCALGMMQSPLDQVYESCEISRIGDIVDDRD
jgi:hypothetical protein